MNMADREHPHKNLRYNGQVPLLRFIPDQAVLLLHFNTYYNSMTIHFKYFFPNISLELRSFRQSTFVFGY